MDHNDQLKNALVDISLIKQTMQKSRIQMKYLSKRILTCIPIGLAVGFVIVLLSYGMEIIGFGWMFRFGNPFCIAFLIVCIGALFYKMDCKHKK